MDVKQVFDTIKIPKDKTDEYITHQQPITVRARTTVYVKDNSVSVSHSNFLMGRRRDNGKVFSRWQTESMAVIRRTPTGKVAFMSRTPQGVYGGIEHFPVFLTGGGEWHSFYKNAIRDQLGIETLGDVYPSLNAMENVGSTALFGSMVIDDLFRPMRQTVRANTAKKASVDLRAAVYNAIPIQRGRHVQAPWERKMSRQIYGALHNDDPTALVELLTGHEYRKDILRALRTVPRRNLSSLGHLRGVETNLVAKAIEHEASQRVPDYRRKALVQNMFDRGYVSRPVFMRLFEDATAGEWSVSDLTRMLGQQMTLREAKQFMRTRTLREAHDELSHEANRRKSPEFNEAIKYNDLIAPINGAEVGKYTIFLPVNGNMIQDWGREMGHCIGSYSRNAYQNAVLAALHEDGKMVANFHLTEVWDGSTPTVYRLNQIYGKRNTIFAGAEEVHDWLLEQDIIVPSRNAGGMPHKPVVWGEVERANINANANNIRLGQIRADRIEAGAIAGMQPGNHLVIGGVPGGQAIQHDANINIRLEREAPIF